MHALEDTSTPLAVLIAILGYSLCSSTLLLLNKMSVEYLNIPSVVSLIQLVVAAMIVFALPLFGVVVDKFEWEKVKVYAIYILAFVAAIYTNMKALSASNVETVIVFRSCSPLAVTVIEYMFLDREWPELRSQISLCCVALGAVLYCLTDSQFALNGLAAYYWVTLYFFLITFEMTYGKILTSNVKMESVWGPVYYCNVLAIFPMFMLGYVNGDYVDVGQKLAEVPATGAWLIFMSCIVGTLIG